MLIRDMPLAERPRSRLESLGPGSLSDAELLSIVLGTPNALNEARQLLSEGLLPLSLKVQISPRLKALFELARRLRIAETPLRQRAEPDSLGPMLAAKYGCYPNEHLGMVSLDSRTRIIRDREVFVGTINSALVSTRDVVRGALEDNAAQVVVVHNHPSGDTNASAEDLMFTRKLREALKLVDIDLVDHLIVAQNRFNSLAQKGQI